FFAQLDERYPGSKFILTVREVGAWLSSAREHWRRYPLDDNPSGRYRSLLQVAMYGMAGFSAARFARVYEAHRRNVEAWFKVRPQDLLVLNVCGGEGWEKLCAFLGKSPPDEPFPWANQGRISVAP